MLIEAISVFPEYFEPLQLSLIGKAISSGLIEVRIHDLRDFAHDRHRTVDDTPYGGGAGMVMKPEPWGEALDSLIKGGHDFSGCRLEAHAGCRESAGGCGLDEIRLELGGCEPHGGRPESGGGCEPTSGGSESSGGCGVGVGQLDAVPTLIFTTPAGVPFTQSVADELATHPRIVFACGRYEGIDQRVVEWARGYMHVREYSLGDYVLNGGEVAALAMIESIVRLIPGVIGNPESLVSESHAAASDGLLEYPVYTRPPTWRGLDVPEVLLSGHHGEVAKWRRAKSEELTAARRPDLLPR